MFRVHPVGDNKKIFYTYVLRSKKDEGFYTGSTNNLRKRFKEHNDNKVFSTKGRGPFELVYYEASVNKDDAKMREKYLPRLDFVYIEGKKK